MSARPSANRTYEQVIADYRQVIDVQGHGPQELSERYEELQGHVASHLLAFSGGNRWGMTFIEAQDDNPNTLRPVLTLLVIYGDESVAVLDYEASVFEVSQTRDSDAEHDSGVMLTSIPADMNELDAFGLFFQLPTRRFCSEFIPW